MCLNFDDSGTGLFGLHLLLFLFLLVFVEVLQLVVMPIQSLVVVLHSLEVGIVLVVLSREFLQLLLEGLQFGVVCVYVRCSLTIRGFTV